MNNVRLTSSQLAAVALVVFVATVVEPGVAWAATGNDVGENLGHVLRHFAGQLYAGVIAVVSLGFLINRRYAELATFLLAAVVVAWLVFSPDDVARAARAIGHEIF
jgi:hypothetical protein